jgi:hypothetical protein
VSLTVSFAARSEARVRLQGAPVLSTTNRSVANRSWSMDAQVPATTNESYWPLPAGGQETGRRVADRTEQGRQGDSGHEAGAVARMRARSERPTRGRQGDFLSGQPRRHGQNPWPERADRARSVQFRPRARPLAQPRPTPEPAHRARPAPTWARWWRPSPSPPTSRHHMEVQGPPNRQRTALRLTQPPPARGRASTH